LPNSTTIGKQPPANESDLAAAFKSIAANLALLMDHPKTHA
jgi:hypothetical protein